MSRLPFIRLRARLHAAISGHDEVVDHLAFALSEEAGAARISTRTLLLAEPGAAADHLVDVLLRDGGVPAVVHDLDTPEYDGGAHEEAALRAALMRLSISTHAQAEATESGALLILRGYLGAAASDRTDWRSGFGGGPRLAAALRVLDGRLPWTGSSDGRPPWTGELAVIAIDEAPSVFRPDAPLCGRQSTAANLTNATLREHGVPDSFADAFSRRYRLAAHDGPTLEQLLRDAAALQAVCDAAYAIGVDVVVATQAIRFLAQACARGEVSLRRAIDLLCEQVERAARRLAIVDAFEIMPPPALVTPDDVAGELRRL